MTDNHINSPRVALSDARASEGRPERSCLRVKAFLSADPTREPPSQRRQHLFPLADPREPIKNMSKSISLLILSSSCFP